MNGIRGGDNESGELYTLCAMYTICSMFAICSFGNLGTGLFPSAAASFENGSN
jgi:hypothetical protein